MTRTPKDPSYEDFLRTAGAAFEAGFREAGTPLPPDVSGAQLARALLDNMREAPETEQAVEIRARIRTAVEAIMRRLESELPGGRAHPAFVALLCARVKAWAHDAT